MKPDSVVILVTKFQTSQFFSGMAELLSVFDYCVTINNRGITSLKGRVVSVHAMKA